MDGIKPTSQPSSTPATPNTSSIPPKADETLSSTPVMVDLLHPSEDMAVPDQKPQDATTLPEPKSVQPAVVADAAVKAEPEQPVEHAPVGTPTLDALRDGALVAPITPPLHAAPEPAFEMVDNPVVIPATNPAPPKPDKTMSDVVVPSVPAPEPAPAFAMPPVDAPVALAPASQSKGKGGKVALVIIIVLIVLAAIGAALYFFVFKKSAPTKPTPAPVVTVNVTAVTPTELTQQGAKDAIAAGGVTASAPTFQMQMATSANAGSVTPQVEVEPVGTAFTGTPNLTGAAVSATGSSMTLSVSGSHLDDGGYHWQARTQVGSSDSTWVTFAKDTASTTADFTVKTSAPTVPSLSSVTGGSVSGTTITVTQNQPTFSGKTDAGTTLSLTVSPDSITLTPTVATDGSWSSASTSTIANGNHTLVVTATDSAGNTSKATYTLNVNQATASTTATPTTPTVTTTPATTATATTPAAPATTTTTTEPAKLASTGDGTTTLTLVGLLLIGLAVAGFIWSGRLRTE